MNRNCTSKLITLLLAFCVTAGIAAPALAADDEASYPAYAESRFRIDDAAGGGIGFFENLAAPDSADDGETAQIAEDLGEIEDPADITNEFADPNFRAVVYNAIGKASPEIIYDSDVANIKSLDVSSQKITSLAGLEFFSGLTRLICNNNSLTSLDVSSNPALEILSCDSNSLTSLDISANTKLTELYCNYNQLAALDISNNLDLKEFSCTRNALTSLDVSANTKLTELYCSSNQLAALDVSGNAALEELVCNNNSLASIDLSSNTGLKTLSLDSNRLTSLDVSANTALQMLYFNHNEITSLDTSNNTGLTLLACYSNQLASLNISKSTGLEILDCDENRLSSLNVSDNSALVTLYCSWNKLTSLNVSKNKALETLACQENQISSLDISNNSALTGLYCALNKLASLNVSNNPALKILDCGENQLTSLNVSNNPALEILDCGVNQLTALDVSNNPALKELYCQYNNMASTSAIAGLNTSILRAFAFSPQNVAETNVSANNNTSTGGGGGSGGSGGSGGGGNNGGIDYTAGTAASAAPTAPVWQEAGGVKTLASSAKSNGEVYVRTKGSGIYGVRAAAWAELSGLRYEHDTSANGALQVRLYIESPEKLTKDALISAWTSGAPVDITKRFFEKWFKNKVRVISFDQAADWEHPVQAAAKPDLTGMDPETLNFYSYDIKANKYRRIEAPEYFIDANGFLRFTTPYAGAIVISEGPLEKR